MQRKDISKISYWFYNRNLPSEVLTEVEVRKITVEFNDSTQQKVTWWINPLKKQTLLFGGQFGGFLHNDSKGFIKTLGIDNPVEVEGLFIKRNPYLELYRDTLGGAFYHFNSHREYPDSLIAVRMIKK